MTSWLRVLVGFSALALSLGVAPVAQGAPAWNQAGGESSAPSTAPASPTRSSPSSGPGESSAEPPDPASEGADEPPVNPHKKLDLKNTTADRPELPVGSIRVVLKDQFGRPVGGKAVKLINKRSSIAEGDSEADQSKASDGEGIALFTGLPTTTDHSYRVIVDESPARFASLPFRLREDMGKEQVIHVLPITRSQAQAQVVGRGVMHVKPRDDVFVIDIVYQLLNVGSFAWVPDQVFLKLPEEFKAFTAQETEMDTRFEERSGVGAELLGTFTPGSHEAAFRFHLPNPHQASYSLKLPLFPRTIDMRVILDATEQMTLRVSEFDPAVFDRLRTGQRVLVSSMSFLERGKQSPEMLSISIGGMRTRGVGHQVALALSIVLVALGFGFSLRSRAPKGVAENLAPEDVNRARDLLLEELVLLERAFEGQSIGKKAYASTRQNLLVSLARLEASTVEAGPRNHPGEADPGVRATEPATSGPENTADLKGNAVLPH